ncbi:MAG TPA: MazG nucleotide pyrophosphohydrolase domain-containing protein [Candidatus Paceibacterota bacterium]
MGNKDMQFEDLMRFIKKEDKRLRRYYGNYKDEEKRILARTVKLSEELGELCDAVLRHNAMQRKGKMKKSGDNLSEEFADVLITTLLLAEAMDIDIDRALIKKMKKIDKRYGK